MSWRTVYGLAVCHPDNTKLQSFSTFSTTTCGRAAPDSHRRAGEHRAASGDTLGKFSPLLPCSWEPTASASPAERCNTAYCPPSNMAGYLSMLPYSVIHCTAICFTHPLYADTSESSMMFGPTASGRPVNRAEPARFQSALWLGHVLRTTRSVADQPCIRPSRLGMPIRTGGSPKVARRHRRSELDAEPLRRARLPVPAPHLRRRLAPAPSPGVAIETRRRSASPLKGGMRHLGVQPGLRGTGGNQPGKLSRTGGAVPSWVGGLRECCVSR
jgi:hypothetical protein